MDTIVSRTGMFQARKEQWPHASAFIEAFCRGARVRPERQVTTSLVLEKLFLHTVRHAQRARSNAPIWITLSASDGRVSFTYEDRAPPFNPFGPRPAEADASIGPQTAGILGILGAQAEYAYLFGRNRISLTID